MLEWDRSIRGLNEGSYETGIEGWRVWECSGSTSLARSAFAASMASAVGSWSISALPSVGGAIWVSCGGNYGHGKESCDSTTRGMLAFFEVMVISEN